MTVFDLVQILLLVLSWALIVLFLGFGLLIGALRALGIKRKKVEEWLDSLLKKRL